MVNLVLFNKSRSKAFTLSPLGKQNISDQVAGYMRDPSKMISRMHLSESAVGVFGEVFKMHSIKGSPIIFAHLVNY